MSFRDKIKPSYEQETLDVPEWGVSVTVASLSLAEKARITEIAAGAHDNLVANLLAATCFDPETGEKAFSGKDDLDWLKAQSAGVTERLAEVATRVSGLTEAAASDPKDASS